MEQIFGVFAVWLAWQVAEPWVAAPKWAWYLSAAVVGIGWQLLADTWTRWYLGIGIGGAAAVLVLVADLLLVATDSAKVNVLRRNR